ncbi:VWA domain-containing protein [Azospirillum picis]|uniref:Flp pilus assembly protein TadG n=1 Tax=Azospirillum picis TaxID=488438 RepID=A0ABU0MNZ8_9PROT|nr:VWA domain-containing protein [Azospirillum picis]MBP2301105.1 Flp pilus assembly protein TadG [Azospirillum picis]MDQ0534933.1 Flp pilus assembly protein TadG [Azospirillum picis]
MNSIRTAEPSRPAGFIADTRGSIAIMVAVSFLVLLGILGVAIDFARAQLATSRIYYAADAATLAVARENFQVRTNAELKALAQQYFDANFPPGTMGATTSLAVATSGTPPTVQGFTVTVTASLPLVFASLIETLGGSPVGSVGITKTSGAMFTSQTSNKGGMEMVIVLDNSGSMSSSQKDLKAGVKALLDMLFESDQTRKNLYVGMVHYNGFVNVLQQAVNAKSDIVTPVKYGTTSASDCPLATVKGSLTGNRHLGNAPPLAFKFDSRKVPDAWGVEDYCRRTVGKTVGTPGVSQALSAFRSDLDTSLASYTAKGSTWIGEGLVWGWRMLSPGWRGLWNTHAEVALPLDYDVPYMKKVIVLMTDGINDVNEPEYFSYNTDRSTSSLDTDLLKICNAAKADHNVVIYTITYGSSVNKTLMRNCASDPSKYYHAALPQDLKVVFTQVGTDLTTMVLVQ